MKYTQEQRTEMLNEMWQEENEKFFNAMKENRSEDSFKILQKLDAITNLLNYLR